MSFVKAIFLYIWLRAMPFEEAKQLLEKEDYDVVSPFYPLSRKKPRKGPIQKKNRLTLVL